jgi:hypothetical protein
MTTKNRMGWLALVFGALASLFWSATALGEYPPQIYDGVTKEQLSQFAERQGWKAELDQGPSLTIRAGDQRVYILVLHCGERGACKSGLIRDMSYHFIKSPEGACSFWHWNIEAKGATCFGPSCVTL